MGLEGFGAAQFLTYEVKAGPRPMAHTDRVGHQPEHPRRAISACPRSQLLSATNDRLPSARLEETEPTDPVAAQGPPAAFQLPVPSIASLWRIIPCRFRIVLVLRQVSAIITKTSAPIPPQAMRCYNTPLLDRLWQPRKSCLGQESLTPRPTINLYRRLLSRFFFGISHAAVRIGGCQSHPAEGQTDYGYRSALSR